MNETSEIKEFGDIKSVLEYLEQVNKDLHKKSFSEQIEFKQEIKKRHNKSQIQMFLGRLEDQFEFRKTISYLLTALFAILSLIIGTLANFTVNNIGELGLNMNSAIVLLFIIFMIALILIGWVIIPEARDLKKLNRYKRLIKECLDEMPEKKYFRRRV
ncbi:hypothetical protein [Bacillus subtilis]|uniref:hypothetical protein n=1 Tax=Bacillus subtilis TaxID=1423 RepID=UPI0024A629A4|nr:hypothetical protein [Bacillus subtilis]